jgi:hypothetical protein
MYDDFDVPDMYDFLEVPVGKKPKVKKVVTPVHDDKTDKDTFEVDEYFDDGDF